MSAGIDTATGLRLGGRHLQRQRAADPRPRPDENLQNLNIVSSIEADPATRLNELWFQQSFLGRQVRHQDRPAKRRPRVHHLGIRGPVHQFGVRLADAARRRPSLGRAGLSAGDARPPPARQADRRCHGSDRAFRRQPGGPAARRPAAERSLGHQLRCFERRAAHRRSAICAEPRRTPRACRAPTSSAPGTIRNRFADPFFGNGATPAAARRAAAFRPQRGDWSLYGTLDQLVLRAKPDSDGGLGFTARAMGAPGDRNLVDVFVQGGLTYKGPFGRDADTVGVGAEWAHIGARARAGDAAAALAGVVLSRALERNGDRGDLPGSDRTMVADPARPAICRQPGRRPCRPGQAGATDRRRGRAWPPQRGDLLTTRV